MKVPEFSTRWYDLAEFFSSHCYTVRILSTECLHRFAVVFLSLQCLLFLPLLIHHIPCLMFKVKQFWRLFRLGESVSLRVVRNSVSKFCYNWAACIHLVASFLDIVARSQILLNVGGYNEFVAVF
jgi:hypothetical protein